MSVGYVSSRFEEILFGHVAIMALADLATSMTCVSLTLMPTC